MFSPSVPLAQTRQLGQGFGPNNEFYISLEDRNKGLMNPLSASQLDVLKAWLEGGEENDSLKPILAAILPDVLIDMDVPELAKLKLPEHLHSTFSDERYFDRLAPRFVLSLRNFFPGLCGGMLKTLLQQPLSEKVKLLFAYLIPALLNVMDKEDRIIASYAIAGLLPSSRFNILFDPDYFNVIIDQKNWNFEHNGRTLRYIPMRLKAIFRGAVWKYDHTHFHLREREYVLLPLKEGVVGEVHTVFRRKVTYGNRTYKQYMAVGIPLAIGRHNPGIEELLCFKSSPINFYELFLSTYNADDALYHTWGSLISNTPAFIDGLRFSLSKTPIEVSKEQHARMTAIFDERMTPLDPDKVLDPIDRRAHRQVPYEW